MANTLRKNPYAKGAWKGIGLGGLALGFACLGCCFTPLFGALAAAGAGATFGSLPFSIPIGLAIAAGSVVGGILFFRKARGKACCAEKSRSCGGSSCDAHIGQPDEASATP